jgi:putative oxidoreductase
MFAAILQGIGVPAPHFMAWLTVLTELLGGLAVLLGAFVTIASVPMTAVLLVAMFKVHFPYGFSSIKLLDVTATGAKFGPVGYEIILLYIACIAALVIGGSGPFAIDGLVRKRFEDANKYQQLLSTAGNGSNDTSRRSDTITFRSVPNGCNAPALASIQRRAGTDRWT